MNLNIESEILAKIRPKPEERAKVYEVISKVVKLLRAKLEKLKAKVEVEGSVAKDTWISGDVDIDIFVLYPENYGVDWVKREGFKAILNTVNSIFEYRIAYAEHPYVQVLVNNIWVDIVPALDIKDPRRCKTTVDRTPHHTRYIKNKLDEKMRDEVRLLKKFMKGIGVYGAEIRVSGFSGYLCELLIIHYGSFRGVLEAASKWKPPIVIDIEGYYGGMIKEVLKKFNNHHIIVVDPVDPNRNVASAVSMESLSKFIAASIMYLKNPSIAFFEPKVIVPNDEVLKSMVKGRGDKVLALKFETPKLHPDILWGEIWKSLKGIMRLLELQGFHVIDYDAWCDEKDTILLIEVLEEELPKVEVRMGPPVYIINNSMDFIGKHLEAKDTVGGPYIRGYRWYVLKRRSMVKPEDYIRFNWRKASISKDIVNSLAKGFELLTGKDVVDASSNSEYKLKLYLFLRKTPPWLQS